MEKGSDYCCLMGNGMMGGKVQVFIRVGWFSKNCSINGLSKIRTSRKGNWDSASILNVNFMVASLDVEVVYKVRSKDATGVIYVSFPKLRWVGIGSEGSVFYIFHYEVSYNY